MKMENSLAFQTMLKVMEHSVLNCLLTVQSLRNSTMTHQSLNLTMLMILTIMPLPSLRAKGSTLFQERNIFLS
jgi:hypothetical protein